MPTVSGVVNRIVRVAGLAPHPQNYNRHDAEQVADLCKSLQEFGQVRSIVVQEDPGSAPGSGSAAGSYLIVAGHGVVAAARAGGWAELRADIIPAGWAKVKTLAYLAADNELARRGNPDEAQLAALVAGIQQADAELGRLAAGGEEALQKLLAAELRDVGAAGGAIWPGLRTPTLIRLVVAMTSVDLVESALVATGAPSRDVALMTICREYLRAKGQYDEPAEGVAATEPTKRDF